MRNWKVEAECAGVPFVWTGPAVNEQAAIRCAAHELAVCRPNVEADAIRATCVVDLGPWPDDLESDAAAWMNDANDGGDAEHGFVAAGVMVDAADWRATHGCTDDCRNGRGCKCADEARAAGVGAVDGQTQRGAPPYER